MRGDLTPMHIEVHRGGQPTRVGTAWLIDGNIAVTAFHVVNLNAEKDCPMWAHEMGSAQYFLKD